MTAPVYVIRDGHVRGKGRYWGGGQVGWVEALAASFRFRTSAADMLLNSINGRVVRVTRKPREVVTLEHHMASVAIARLAALEEARDACLALAREALARGRLPMQQIDFVACAHAIAALMDSTAS